MIGRVETTQLSSVFELMDWHVAKKSLSVRAALSNESSFFFALVSATYSFDYWLPLFMFLSILVARYKIC